MISYIHVPCPGWMNALLNTCNRTEIYGASNNGFSPDLLRRYLSEFRNLDPDFLQTFISTPGEKVVRHLFEVTSGIDSQMVGETELRQKSL